jgi:hypothetical protein
LGPRCPSTAHWGQKLHYSEPGARPLARGGPGDQTFAPPGLPRVPRLGSRSYLRNVETSSSASDAVRCGQACLSGMRRSRARRYCSEDTGCPCQEEDQETARGGIGCRAGERAGRIGLGRAAAHGRRRTRAVLQRRGSVRDELSVAGAPVRQAIASGADESLRRRLYHLVLIHQNS